MRYLLVLLLPLAAHATTYNVDFTAGGGLETVSGSIDLLPGTTGPVIASEITAWSLSGTGTAPFSYSGSSVSCGSICGLSVSDAALTFDPPPDVSAIFGPLGLTGQGGRYPNPELEVQSHGNYAFFLPSSVQIASAVPEIDPEGAGAAITFLAGLLALFWNRPFNSVVRVKRAES